MNAPAACVIPDQENESLDYVRLVEELSASYSDDVKAALYSEAVEEPDETPEENRGESESKEQQSSSEAVSDSRSSFIDPFEVRNSSDLTITQEATAERVQPVFNRQESSRIRVKQMELELELHYRDKHYKQKARYSGPLRAGLPDGVGVLWFECGDLYIGEFHMGEMHGVGAFNHKRRHNHIRQIFRGDFVHNEFVGMHSVPPIDRVRVSKTEHQLDIPAALILLDEALDVGPI